MVKRLVTPATPKAVSNGTSSLMHFCVRWFPGNTVSAQNAKDALAAVASLGGDHHISMLIDITGIAGLNRAARAVFARHRSARKVALLGISPVDRLIASYFAALDPRLVVTPFFHKQERRGGLAAPQTNPSSFNVLA